MNKLLEIAWAFYGVFIPRSIGKIFSVSRKYLMKDIQLKQRGLA